MLKAKRILIDPGHGGNDPGAIGRDKLFEKVVTLEFALRLRDQLKSINPNLNVLLTRITDTTLPVPERIKLIKNLNPDLLISIHCNAANTAQANGFEILVHERHRPLLQNILNDFARIITEKFKLRNRGIKDGSWVGILNNSPCPAFLIELAFITSETTFPDFNLLRDKQQIIAFTETVADFINKTFT